MTAEEALKAILGKIDAPEELDEEINVITESIRSGANDGYKERYEDLREKYIARFGEMLSGQEMPSKDIEEPVADVTPEMLDFDGSTE